VTAPFRALHVAHDHPGWTAGGTEFAAADLVAALSARPGVEARLLAAATDLQRPGAAALDGVGADLALRPGRYDRFMMSAVDAHRLARPLGEALAGFRPDVVHFHGVDRIGVEAIALARRLAPGARIVMSLHDYQPICAADGLMLTPAGRRCAGASPDGCRRCLPEQPAERFAMRRAWLLAVLRGVDLFAAPSAFLRDRYLDWGLEPGLVTVVPNAVPDRPTGAPPFALATAEGPPDRFGFFGAVAERKGVLTLLAAARRLAADSGAATVTLHGDLGHADGAFRDRFRAALAAADPVAGWAGPYDRAEVAARMATVDWVVVPSLWWEGAPLVILEAFRAGRPVICSGVGGMAELVRDGVDGLHAPAGDVAALAATLRRASGDRPLWRRLAAAIVPPPTPAAQAARMLDLYRSLGARAPA
jgi:glycosyltransferase involved in cell wall biosynthesis